MARSEHKENSKAWWDERFVESGDSFLYSKEPSKFILDHVYLVPEGGKILDLGCGEGRNAVALALKGYDVTAMDFSETAIARAKKLAEESGATVNWKVADLDFFIPDLMSFDAAICSNFIPPKALQKNIVRGIKQNGHLLVEAHLMAAAQAQEGLEAFECVKPGELLTAFQGASSGLRILFYSELSEEPKAFLVAKKAELF